MAYRVYFENSAGRASEEATGIARLTYFPGPRDFQALVALLGHVVRLLGRRGDGCLLVDQQHMAPFTQAEQEFMIQQWLPQAVAEGGYRFGAVILAENAVTRLATRSVTTAVRDFPVLYQYFDQEAEAVTWLLQRKQQQLAKSGRAPR